MTTIANNKKKSPVVKIGERKKLQGTHHKYIVNELGEYTCNYCEKTSKNQSTISEHISRLHASEAGRIVKPFECPTCQKRFNSVSIRDQHIQNNHFNIRDNCMAPGCNYKGKSGSALCSHYARKHMDSSSLITEVDCEISMCNHCSKHLNKSSILYHLAICSPISPYCKSIQDSTRATSNLNDSETAVEMSRVEKIMEQLEMMKIDLARQKTTEQKNRIRGLMKTLIGRIPEAKRLDEIECKLDDMKKELDVTSNPESQKMIMRQMRQIVKGAHESDSKEDLVDLSNAKPADKIGCPESQSQDYSSEEELFSDEDDDEPEVEVLTAEKIKAALDMAHELERRLDALSLSKEAPIFKSIPCLKPKMLAVDLSNAKPADKICCPFGSEKVETKTLLQSEPPVLKKPRKERTVKKPRRKIIIIEDSDDDDSVPIAQLIKVKKTKVTKVTKTTKTSKKRDAS
jgi:hypothetical protein